MHDGAGLWLRGEILRPDGSEVIRGEVCCAIAEAAEAGGALARDLLGQAPKGFFDWR